MIQPTGTVLTREMLTTKGPGTGISPMRLKQMVGKKTTAAIAGDTIIPETSVDWTVAGSK
jgi:sialic acid synthase SpsE